eukprot:3127815-Amphidinium_carterae.1
MTDIPAPLYVIHSASFNVLWKNSETTTANKRICCTCGSCSVLLSGALHGAPTSSVAPFSHFALASCLFVLITYEVMISNPCLETSKSQQKMQTTAKCRPTNTNLMRLA